MASTRYSARMQHAQLAEVQLGHEHLLELLQHLAESLGQRVQVAQVAGARPACPACCSSSVAALIAPKVLPQPTTSTSPLSGPVQSMSCPAGLMLATFGRAGADHVLVVGRVVVDVAGDVLLFEAADAVLRPGVPGKRPRADERSRRACTA